MKCPVCQKEIVHGDSHVHGHAQYAVEHGVTDRGQPVEKLVMSEWYHEHWQPQVILAVNPLEGGL